MHGTPAPATLQQVADRAGVSIGTASAALSHARPVSAEARARVLDAAAELSYVPMRQRKSTGIRDPGNGNPGVPAAERPLIAIIMGEPTGGMPASSYHGRILTGVRAACARLGADLHERLLRAKTAAVPSLVEQGRVDGVVVIAGRSAPGLVARIRDLGVACVEVDHADRTPEVDAVRHDDVMGGYLATRHLLDLGHTRPVPAVIAGPSFIAAAHERFLGYRKALAEFRLEYVEDYVQRVNFCVASGSAAMDRLLDLPEPPTAVFCGNDETAEGAIAALHHRGLAVPGDVSVVGFDDASGARLVDPPLTTVRVECEAAGRHAVRLLLDRIEDLTMVGRTVQLQVSLVRRGSTGPPGRRLR